jgi:pilus assembly protein Flp/PilA
MVMLTLRSLIGARSGVTAIEYGLIAGLVAVAIIVGATVIGSSVNNVFVNLGNHTTPTAAT